MSTEYTTRAGEKVCVLTSMDPFKHLGISSSASTGVIKCAVRKEMLKPERQDCAMASLAYHMITSSGNRYQKRGTVYQVILPDVFFFAAIGHRDEVIAEIEKDPQLITSVDERKHTALYLAARCGFSDIVETLIHKGADVNHRQCVNCTPLHVAAYYGQKDIYRILLVYGADPTLKNNHGNTPVTESSAEFKQDFAYYERDPFLCTLAFFNSNNYTSGMQYISYGGNIIGAEVFRSTSQIDEVTRHWWSRIQCDWEVAYHGTKHKYIESILTYGLLPSGVKLPNGEIIKIPSNHIQPGQHFIGDEDWVKAIFVSPSIMYASHQFYSEHIHHGDSQWCMVLKVFINPSLYKSYNSTIVFEPIEGEPENIMYQVEDSTFESSISQVSSQYRFGAEMLRNVVVASVIFMYLSFRKEI